jgi:hypothetical protein
MSDRMSKTEIPMKRAKSVDGITQYLAKKHGGNIDHMGVVTLTSSSV